MNSKQWRRQDLVQEARHKAPKRRNRDAKGIEGVTKGKNYPRPQPTIYIDRRCGELRKLPSRIWSKNDSSAF